MRKIYALLLVLTACTACKMVDPPIWEGLDPDRASCVFAPRISSDRMECVSAGRAYLCVRGQTSAGRRVWRCAPLGSAGDAERP